MKVIFRRTLSFLFALVLTLSVTAPAASAASAVNDLPVVYVQGVGNTIYSPSGKVVYPQKKDITSAFSKHTDELIDAGVDSYLSGNWKILENAIYNIIAPLFKPLWLDGNAEPSNGSYPKPNDAVISKTKNFTLKENWFRYDWRLDPVTTADELSVYIDEVLEATGKSKVQLVSRCLGTSIIAAYLTYYGADRVDNVVFYAGACNGAVPIGSFFSGKLSIDSKTLSSFGGSMPEDGDFTDLINVFSNILKRSSLISKIVDKNVDEAAQAILPRLLLATYATFPSYWSMISDEYYEDAKKLVFSGKEDKYAGLISKIDNYHYNVQATLPSTLLQLQSEGLKIINISKYDYELKPLYKESYLQSDATVELSTMSFGATSANFGETLSSSYISKVKARGDGKYISPDLVVDGSTALFPDYTWYIKNCHHNTWPDAIDEFMMTAFRSGKQYTVTSNKKYPQYIQYNRVADTISKVTRYPSIYKIKISDAIYTGKKVAPTLKIINSGGNILEEGVDYSVAYSKGCVDIGKYYLNIYYKGQYKGMETVYFNIVPQIITPKVAAATNAITLSWSPVSYADGYRVYMYNSKTGKYDRIKSTNATSYTVSKLAAGRTYKFVVKAYKNVNGTLYYSPQNVITTATKPKAPSLKITPSAKSAVLKWGSIAGANGYEVYMATSQNGKFEKISTTSALSITKSGLTAGKTYYFKMRAYKTVKDTKIYSSYTKAVAVKITNKPAAAAISLKTASKAVTVTWNKVPGANGYIVYMATSKDGKYTKLASVSGTSFTKKKLVKGRTYYFKVRSWTKTSSGNVYGNFSTAKSIVVK